MDFVYSEEQQMLRDGVDRYGRETWQPANRRSILAEGPEGARRRWREMAELGWLMLPIPEAMGGLGGGAVEVMAVMEGFGRHLMTGPYVTTCVLAPALLAAGGDAAEALLTDVSTGAAIVAAGLIESDGGYDPGHVATHAERVGDGYRLSGAKAHVEDGADADWFIVSARTSGSTDDVDGISLFLLPADAPGLTVERFRAIDHHRHARLRLDGVSRITLLGDADAASAVIDAAIDRAICAHLAEATGSMEAALEATLEHLRTRQQFGVAIGTFQALQHRAVDMAVACEEARAMTYQATLAVHRPAAAGRRRPVSAGKVRVAQSGIYVGQQAVQLHGGVGFSEELIVSHHLRRQMMLDLAHGPLDHHRARFAAA